MKISCNTIGSKYQLSASFVTNNRYRLYTNIPPVWHVCIVVPVLSVLLCVDIGVHPSLAAGRRGSRHRSL